HRKLEARKHAFRNRGAAEHMPSLAYHHLLACARKIGRVYQSVMPAADDNNVILRVHRDRAKSIRPQICEDTDNQGCLPELALREKCPLDEPAEAQGHDGKRSCREELFLPARSGGA